MFLLTSTSTARRANPLVIASLATILAAIPLQVANADAPDWSSRVGTGKLFVGGVESQAAGSRAPSLAPWSAHIGTGRVAAPASGSEFPARSSTAPAAVHSSARIGTGHTEIIS